MNKLRPYKGTYRLPIHKHARVKYPKSKWILQLGNFRYTNTEAMWLINSIEYPKITDLTKKPKVITQEEILAHNANSKPYVLKVETNKSIPDWWVLGGKEPIKPKKLGFIANLKNWRNK